MSDTPRTDAASRMAFSGEYMVPIEDAQKLERDLAQYKEANAGLMRACDNLERELAEANRRACEYYLTDESVMVMESPDAAREARKKAAKLMIDMERELAELTKQRDALAEALREIASGAYSWKTCVDVIAPKALAATKGGSHE
jgi:hypothetical protein